MKNFYSTVILENNMFFGIVYSSSSNSELYKTTGYSSQILAMRDTNNFIKKNQINSSQSDSVASNDNSSNPQTYISPRRCCGR